MDGFEFLKWKNSHANEMADLTFCKPDDIFIFTRFTEQSPSYFEGKQVLFAENFEDIAGYLHHIFLYDILYDAIEDVEFDFKSQFDERQEKIIKLLSFWHKSAKISVAKNSEKTLLEFCEKFNSEFNETTHTEYEIRIFKGLDKLKKFLIEKFSENENFDEQKLCNICNKDAFAGRVLEEFLNELFL